MSRAAVIIAAARTPIARLDGDLATLDADTLAATIIRHLLTTSGIERIPVDDVIFATAAGPGGNLARRAALGAGLPVGVPGMTIDRQCGGGLDAIALACRLVEAGAGDVYVAGGVESASTSPLRKEPSRDGGARGRRFFPRQMFAGGDYDDPGMAESAEIIAEEWAVDRARQDAFAAESHRRAVAARDAGVFTTELVLCPVETDDGHREVVHDSCPRATLTAERMARFPSLVYPGGSVTAANSSQIADGAAAVLVTSARIAERFGRPGLVHRGSATVGVDPRVCGIGAVAAAHALAAKDAAFDVTAMAQIAITEAFASQTLATADELALDLSRINPHGGAIALGHPWGASGAIQVVRLFTDLARSATPGGQGLALAAIAGGMGTASWFEADALT